MMRNQLAAADSANQAQAILGAWTSGNIELFRQQLNRVEECAAEPVESDEIERMELLRAIAEDLRGPSVQAAATDPANVYGALLRHLASGFERRQSAPHLPGTVLSGSVGAQSRLSAL